MADVIDIRRARLMRAIGRPANTPVEVLPAPAMRAMSEGLRAGTSFYKRIDAFAINPNARTYAAARRAFDRFVARPFLMTRLSAGCIASEFASELREWADIFDNVLRNANKAHRQGGQSEIRRSSFD